MAPTHPDPPSSAVVVAARERLLARLAASTSLAGAAERRQDGEEDAGERYEIGEPFASGGLGVIRRAYDRRLGRVVAVKELRRRETEAERRFLLEAAITARLQHPGIVPLYDIGRFPTGEPYYCMKLVEGRSLEQAIAGATTPRARLGLVEHVLAAADAIAYAHRHAVVHRDIKPANILVGAHGETVVIDWGLAKDTSGTIAEALREQSPPDQRATLTDVGAIVGTLRYMPPEQARGEEIDARSDVFALGAVLFHVIAGRPPHALLDRGALLERLIADRVDDLRPLAGDAPRALVAIAQKAMSARPGERYSSAEALADDLRRFLAGRLVDAHRYQPGDLLRLWWSRHRAALVIAGLAAGLLIASSTIFVVNLRAERDTAAAARLDAESAQREAVRRADAAVLAQARATLADDLDAAIGLLRQVDLSEETNARRARSIALEAVARGAPDRVLRGHTRAIERIAGLSTGELVSVDVGGEVRRWNLETGEGAVVADLDAPRGTVIAAAEAPVWVALAGRRGIVFRGDEPPETIELATHEYNNVSWDHRWELSRHGETLAALGTHGHRAGRRVAAAYLWDLVARPALPRTLPFEHVSSSALGPDGTMVAITGPDRHVLLVEGENVTPLPQLRAPSSFSPDGRYLIAEPAGARGKLAWSRVDGSTRTIGGRRLLAFTGDDHVLLEEENPNKTPLVHEPRFVLRSLITGEDRWTIEFDESRELAQALAPWNGGFAVAGGGERFALHIGGRWRIWSMTTGKLEEELETGPHPRGEFLADGRFAVARNTDVWVWAPSAPSVAELQADALARDGSRAVGNFSGKRRLLRVDDRRETPALCLEGADWRGLNDRSERIAVDGRGRVLHVGGKLACLGERPEVAVPIELPDRASAAALAEDGEGFAVGLVDGTVLAWERATAEPQRWRLADAIDELAVFPGGAAFVALTRSGWVHVLRDRVDAPVVLGAAAQARFGLPLHAAFHPHRPEVAVPLAREDALVFYDAGSDTLIRRPLQLPPAPSVAYGSSGRRVAVGVAGRRVLILDDPEQPGRELTLPEEACGLGFVGEDELAALGQLGALLRVDLVTGDVALLHRDKRSVTLGAHALVASASGEVRVFSGVGDFDVHRADTVPRDRDDLRAWLAARAR